MRCGPLPLGVLYGAVQNPLQGLFLFVCFVLRQE